MKPIEASKTQLCQALRAFINQRSGIDFQNYQCSDWKKSREAFMGDYRPILKHGRHARQLLRAVELRDSITAQDVIAATSAYSGRLQFVQPKLGEVYIDYTTGQYFPTEYRNAACAVLAYCLINYWRKDGNDWRKMAKQEFGRGIASVWFK